MHHLLEAFPGEQPPHPVVRCMEPGVASCSSVVERRDEGILGFGVPANPDVPLELDHSFTQLETCITVAIQG